MSLNIYQIITDRIIDELNKGLIPWRKPWKSAGRPVNYITQKPYNGINLLLLPYSGEWATFKQIKDCGGKVKAGSKSSMIVFFKMLDKKDDTDKDEEESKKIPFLRYSNVFHIGTQTEGLESKIKPVIGSNDINPIEEAEKALNDYINRSGVNFEAVNGSNEAFYSISNDKIVVPHMIQYTNVNEYYSVIYHEAGHSTGHKSRLDRLDKNASFDSQTYSKEELIAEIASCMTLNILGLEIPETFENSIAYIQNWKQKLIDDNKIILQSANQAQKAVNMILNIEAE